MSEHDSFYQQHYSDWTVHKLPLLVYVPTNSWARSYALDLVRETLEEAAFDIRVSDLKADVDRWSRHLLHTSQHNSMPIFLGGRLQKQANGMRKAVGLEPFGWGDAIPDAEFGECSVHHDCLGQETHD